MVTIKKIGNAELFCIFTALLGIGIFWSFLIISIASILLAVLFVFQIELYPIYRIRLNPNSKQAFLDLFKNPLLLCFVLLFLLGLLSFFWSDNLKFYLKSNQMRLQLLIIPLSILAHKDLPKNYFYCILRAFIIAASISAGIVLYYYIKNHDLYIYAMQFGKSFYTPVQHIRYTAMLVMAFGAAVMMFKENNFPKERPAYLIVAVFFFLMIHLLAVKGSILSLYFLCIVLLFSFLSKKISKFIRYLLIVMLILLFGLSVKFIPSWNSKLQFVKFEISEYKAGRWQNLSDLERLVSYQVGWESGLYNK